MTDTRLKAALRKADPVIVSFFSELYPDVNLKGDIRDIVTSYEAACEVEGIKPLTIDHFSFLPKEDREYHFADHQMTVIRRALNEGWTWQPGENGYFPVFNRPSAAGGPGFSCHDYNYDISDSSVGARRTFKTSALAEFAGNQFLSIQEIIHNEKEN